MSQPPTGPQQYHPQPQQYQPQPQQYQPQPQQYQPQYQPPQPQIVIQNNATASARAFGGMLPRKRHSLVVHVVLFFLTSGIGNLVYWWWIANENRRRGY